MSRQYNPAVVAYRNMDIENMPVEKETKETGLLARKTSMTGNGTLDYSSPAVRAAMQMQVIRRHRDEINATD